MSPLMPCSLPTIFPVRYDSGCSWQMEIRTKSRQFNLLLLGNFKNSTSIQLFTCEEKRVIAEERNVLGKMCDAYIPLTTWLLWEQVQTVLYKNQFDIFVIACFQRDLKCRWQIFFFECWFQAVFRSASEIDDKNVDVTKMGKEPVRMKRNAWK